MGSLPDRIGSFRPLSVLGRGGMGVVYRAEHMESGDIVALKTVLAPADVERARIRDEIEALRSLQHPNVVRILAAGDDSGVPWYAMELLEGRTLAAWIADLWKAHQGAEWGATVTVSDAHPFGTTQRSRIDLAPLGPQRPARERPGPSLAPAGAGRLREVLALARGICAPLAFIHGEGLVHRDLKPANVFVRADGSVVLMDFGLVSRALGTVGREVLEAPEKLVGTVPYVAPEQINGRFVDARADLYALGCTLYAMITGRTPFCGTTVTEILWKHLAEPPTPPSAITSGVPPALDALILALLAKDRRLRLGYADDVAAELAELGGDPRAAPAPCPRSYLYRSELVGRTDLLARVRADLDASSAGRGAFLILGGESGIGKTFLLAEIAREALARRMDLVLGECLADAAGAPLGPLRPLLRAVAAASIRGGRAEANRLLGPRGRLLALYEPALAAVPGHDEHPAPLELPLEAARPQLLSALRETLAAFSERAPVLLVIDDLQWADELSLQLLESLSPELFTARGLVVLATYRSEWASPALRVVLEAPHVCELSVDRFDECGIATLVGHMLALVTPPAPFVRFLARCSEGNPFFVAEYLRAAIAAGHLRRRDGTWNLTEAPASYEALPLPRSLRELISVRLDALSSQARELADLGAVIGRELDVDLLAVASRREPDQVRALLVELRARQVTEPMADGRHRFTHDKVREVAYAALGPDTCRALHLAVAEAMAARLAAHVGPPAPHAELGYHFQLAGDVERAVDHLEQAGEIALARLAHVSAARTFVEVVALAPRLRTPPSALRRARWHTRIAEAEHAGGRPEAGRAHAACAAALLTRPVPQARPLIALDALGALGEQALHRAFPGRFVAAVPRADEALQTAARAYHALMKCSFMTADGLVILHATLHCLNLAERAGPSPTLANAYAASSCTAAMLGLDALSRAYARRAHASLDRSEDAPARSFALAMEALSHLARGEWKAMYAAAERGTAIASTLGFGRRVDELQTTLAWAELVRGDLIASEERYLALRAMTRRDTQADLWIRVGLAAIHVEQGRLDDAQREIDVPEERCRESAQRTELLGLRTLRAVVGLRRGDRQAARRSAEEALAMIRSAPLSSLVALPSYERLAEALGELWGGEQGRAARAGLAEASRVVCDALARGARRLPIWRPAALLASGRHAFHAGKRAPARAAWEAALLVATELSMPRHVALARRSLGRQG